MTEVTKSLRTFDEQVEYFEWLAWAYGRDAVRARTELERVALMAKSEAYELAAFELSRNMQH